MWWIYHVFSKFYVSFHDSLPQSQRFREQEGIRNHIDQIWLSGIFTIWNLYIVIIDPEVMDYLY